MRFTRVLLLACVPASIYAYTSLRLEELAKLVQSQASDENAARSLSDVYLTERLSDDTLARMLREAPGPKTQTALRELAADSAFLDPPLVELPQREKPGLEEQKTLLARAVQYASGFVRALPDFVCSIETRLLDDDLRHGNGAEGKWERFHLRDVAVSGLTFEAGKETYKVQAINGRLTRDSKPLQGLTTWGEFGPLMSELFLEDSDPSFFWSHWEIFEGKQLAVLGYSVNAAHSHYAVTWCCSAIIGAEGKYPPVTTKVAYTGQIFLDPGSGAILRITRQTADLPIESHIDLIRTVVEYRPVEIGGSTYICPFRSISVARETRNIARNSYDYLPETVTNLNEVRFTGYHKFEIESKILSGDEPSSPKPPEVTLFQPPKEAPLFTAPIPDRLDLPPANPPEAATTQPTEPSRATFGTTVVMAGALHGDLYYLPPGAPRLPKFDRMEPVGAIYADALNISPRDFREGFPGVTSRFEWFAIDYRGKFWIEKPGKYEFSLLSDDGAILYLDDRVVIDNDGLHPPKAKTKAFQLSGGVHSIRVSYFQGPRLQVALVLSIKGPGKPWRVFSTREFSPPVGQVSDLP
jgi:hypothetical protein